MRGVALLLFIAMVVAAIFSFSSAFESYPLYSTAVTITPYQFSTFLFWMFMMLFLAAIVVGVASWRHPPSERELKQQENTITGGFEVALFLLVIAVFSGIFGFSVIASTMAGLSMIIFWIAVVLGIVAMIMGIVNRRSNNRGM